jgi:hypothetical protein
LPGRSTPKIEPAAGTIRVNRIQWQVSINSDSWTRTTPPAKSVDVTGAKSKIERTVDIQVQGAMRQPSGRSYLAATTWHDPSQDQDKIELKMEVVVFESSVKMDMLNIQIRLKNEY